MRSLLTSENEFEEANVTPQDLRAGVVAIGRGPVKITGELPLMSIPSINLQNGDSISIPRRCIVEPFEVTRPSLEEETPATAVAGDILQGKTAWVNGSLLTGTKQAPESVDRLIALGSDVTVTTEGRGDGTVCYAVEGSVTSFAGEAQIGSGTKLKVLAPKTLFPSVAEPLEFLGITNLQFKEIIGGGHRFYGFEGSGIVSEPKVINPSTYFSAYTGTYEFGNAQPSDVRSGKTFTSQEGLKITGTMAEVQELSTLKLIPNGFEDPGDTGGASIFLNLSLPGSDAQGKVSADTAIKTELLMSEFGDVTAAQVMKGKTFTSRAGIKQTGSMPAFPPGRVARCDLNYTYSGVKLWSGYGVSWDSSFGGLRASIAFADVFSTPKNGSIGLVIPGSELGDAVASDVLKGKTFTSATGKKVVGTLEAAGLDGVQCTLLSSVGYTVIIQVPLTKEEVRAFYVNTAGNTPFKAKLSESASLFFAIPMLTDFGGLGNPSHIFVKLNGSNIEFSSVAFTTPDGQQGKLISWISTGCVAGDTITVKVAYL